MRLVRRVFASAVLIAVALFGMASCGGEGYEEVENLRGTHYKKYEILCADGVEYIRTHSGIAGHYKPDGSLYTCETKD